MNEIKLCPVCGGNTIDPVAVYVRTVDPGKGPIVHTITSDGYTVREPYNDFSPRGVIIIREYLGECGHRWIEKEQFHKGNTFQEWRQLDALVGPDRVIWRD